MQRLNRTRAWDLAIVFPAAILIFGYCYFVSRHRILWSDELFGWMLVSDPSWRHMLQAWNLGADGGGLGFYVTCRLWLTLFGRSLLPFRAFSAMGVFLGFAATWFSLRRYYPPVLAAISLTAVWFGSRVVLWHIVQTRFYGMLLGMAACAFCLSLRSAAETDAPRGRTATLVLTFVANLLLVSTHPFGLGYSILIVGAAAVDDLLSRRRRWTFYAAAIAPWTILLVSLTALRNSARVGKPWFWTTRPSFADLRSVYLPDFFHEAFHVAVVLLFIVLASSLWKLQRRKLVTGLVSRRGILIPGVLFLLVPVCFWLISQGATSYFVDRYFCPFAIGVAIFGAELLTDIFSRPMSLDEPMPLLFATALGLFVLHGVIKDCMLPCERKLTFPSTDFTGELAAMLPRNEPVVIQRADIFDLMVYYRNAPDLPMVTPVDWPLALSSSSPRWLVSAYHEMENWKLAGYYSNQIVDSSAFLKSCPRFIVIADDITPWFDQRIGTQPGWHVRKLGEFEKGMWTSTIWEVTR